LANASVTSERLLFAAAGAATGILFGTLIGLSASPIVGTVVGGAITLGAAVLEMRRPRGVSGESGHTLALALTVFSLTCLSGVLGGLWLRTHDALGATPEWHVARWVKAGYTVQEARRIVASVGVGGTGSAAPTATPSKGVLFGADVARCDQTRPGDYADATNLALAFESAGSEWKSFSEATAAITDKRLRFSVLSAGWQLVCR
jgi:hypothetical protein